MIFQVLDFLDRGLLLTGKLLNQGLLANKLKSSIRTFHSRHHDLVTSYGIPFVTTTIPSYFPLSWLITGFVTRVARRVWPVTFGALEFTISLFYCGVPVAQSLVFCVVLYKSLFVLLSFCIWSLLRYTTSDDTFGIIKLFLWWLMGTTSHHYIDYSEISSTLRYLNKTALRI